MFYKEAILSRKSRRKFTKEIPDISHIVVLRDTIEEINAKENLNIQLIVDNTDGFDSIKSSYGFFSGVKNYIALVGPKADENIHEKLGYYGEQLLLTCETLGYGTCWVGGTFDREKCACNVNDDEVFVCVIVFGYVKKNDTIKEKAIRSTLHTLKKGKKIEEMFHSEENPPNWFIEGMRMVQKAPSALNKQPILFYYSGNAVMARIREKEMRTMAFYDLGISKFHFAVGAGGGNWEFGNGGLFIKEEDDE